MLAIEFSINIFLLALMFAAAFMLGYIVRAIQIQKCRKKIVELEKEMLNCHAQILELEKEKAKLLKRQTEDR